MSFPFQQEGSANWQQTVQYSRIILKPIFPIQKVLKPHSTKNYQSESTKIALFQSPQSSHLRDSITTKRKIEQVTRILQYPESEFTNNISNGNCQTSLQLKTLQQQHQGCYPFPQDLSQNKPDQILNNNYITHLRNNQLTGSSSKGEQDHQYQIAHDSPYNQLCTNSLQKHRLSEPQPPHTVTKKKTHTQAGGGGIIKANFSQAKRNTEESLIQEISLQNNNPFLKDVHPSLNELDSICHTNKMTFSDKHQDILCKNYLHNNGDASQGMNKPSESIQSFQNVPVFVNDLISFNQISQTTHTHVEQALKSRFCDKKEFIFPLSTKSQGTGKTKLLTDFEGNFQISQKSDNNDGHKIPNKQLNRVGQKQPQIFKFNNFPIQKETTETDNSVYKFNASEKDFVRQKQAIDVFLRQTVASAPISTKSARSDKIIASSTGSMRSSPLQGPLSTKNTKEGHSFITGENIPRTQANQHSSFGLHQLQYQSNQEIGGNIEGTIESSIRGNIEGNIRSNIEGKKGSKCGGNIRTNIGSTNKGNIGSNISGSIGVNIESYNVSNIEGKIGNTDEGIIEGNIEGQKGSKCGGKIRTNIGINNRGNIGSNISGKIGVNIENYNGSNIGVNIESQKESNIEGKIGSTNEGNIEGKIGSTKEGNIEDLHIKNLQTKKLQSGTGDKGSKDFLLEKLLMENNSQTSRVKNSGASHPGLKVNTHQPIFYRTDVKKTYSRKNIAPSSKIIKDRLKQPEQNKVQCHFKNDKMIISLPVNFSDISALNANSQSAQSNYFPLKINNQNSSCKETKNFTKVAPKQTHKNVSNPQSYSTSSNSTNVPAQQFSTTYQNISNQGEISQYNKQNGNYNYISNPISEALHNNSSQVLSHPKISSLFQEQQQTSQNNPVIQASPTSQGFDIQYGLNQLKIKFKHLLEKHAIKQKLIQNQNNDLLQKLQKFTN